MASEGCCELPWLPAFLVPEITPSWREASEPGAGSPGKPFCSPGAMGPPVWGSHCSPWHTGLSLCTAVAAFTLGIWALQGQGRPLPSTRHLARPIRAASHCELGPESRLQKDKTKAGPAGSPASTGEPGYPPGLAGQLLSPGAVGRVSEPVPAAPSSGPSTPT